MPEKRSTPELVDAAPGATCQIPIAQIKPNPEQPRINFNKDRLEELAASIKRVGLLNPLSVLPDEDGTFILVGGERRLQAVKKLGWEEVDAHILDPRLLEKQKGGTTLRELALIENIQREDLNPVEEGEAYKKLIEEHKWNQKQLGDRLGKAQSFISDKIRLTELEDQVKKLIAEGSLSFSQAREVVRIKDAPAEQAKAAKKIASENMTVLEAKALVDSTIGKPEKQKKGATRKTKAYTPKKAISALSALDQGLKLLKPDKVKDKWRKDLLKSLTSFEDRIKRLRESLEARDPG